MGEKVEHFLRLEKHWGVELGLKQTWLYKFHIV